MRRRWADLARRRELEGANPMNWRRGGYGVPMPYPALPGYNLPRRVRHYHPAGNAPPMLADALVGPGAGPGPGPGPGLRAVPGLGMGPAPAPHEWQPLVGMVPDWGMPLLPPPPEGAWGVARDGAARRGHGGVDGAQPQAARKRAMLIAQADRAMARHNVAAGSRPGGMGRAHPPGRAIGAAEDDGAARLRVRGALVNGVDPSDPARLAQRMDDKRAMVEAKKRIRRDARQELEDLMMEESGRPPNFLTAALAGGGGVGGGADGIRAGGGSRIHLHDNDQKEREREEGHAVGNDLGMYDLHGRDPWVHRRREDHHHPPEPGGRDQGGDIGRRRQRVMMRYSRGLADEDQGRKREVEGEGASDADRKRFFGVLGWGGAGRWWNGGGEGVGQASHTQEPDKPDGGHGNRSRSRSFSALLAASNRHEEAKIGPDENIEDIDVGGESMAKAERLARGAQSAAASSEDAGGASGRVKYNSIDGDGSGGNVAHAWVDLLPWPLRAVGGKANAQGDEQKKEPLQEVLKKESEDGPASDVATASADSDDDVIIVGEKDDGHHVAESSRQYAAEVAAAAAAASAGGYSGGASSPPIIKRRRIVRSRVGGEGLAAGADALQVRNGKVASLVAKGEGGGGIEGSGKLISSPLAEVESYRQERADGQGQHHKHAPPAARSAAGGKKPNASESCAAEGLADMIASVEGRALGQAVCHRPISPAPPLAGGAGFPRAAGGAAPPLPPQFPDPWPPIFGAGVAAPAYHLGFDRGVNYRQHSPVALEKRARDVNTAIDDGEHRQNKGNRRARPQPGGGHHQSSSRGRMAAEGMMKLRAERQLLRARERASALRSMKIQRLIAVLDAGGGDSSNSSATVAGDDEGGNAIDQKEDGPKSPPPLSTLTKEEREEMIKRALKRYSFYQVLFSFLRGHGRISIFFSSFT